MFADFAGLVSTGTGWERPLTEVVTTTAVVCAAYESARRGGTPVSVPEHRPAVTG
ncbi:hypothetical protein Prum_004000 [Phytohabitans rumicis]|uniref:Gfo/Idh/MocA-like oxidoreductase C-terminal domain-containing protein n=2 Tax=Phytohabitans rumicis TaxID=1076125 RepID=A0A6V8KVL5_9ACTN|nr:hypothetical protein Prum_004000 [Phytohabitans rumicis]